MFKHLVLLLLLISAPTFAQHSARFIEDGDTNTGLQARVSPKGTGENALHVITEILGIASDAVKDFFFEVGKDEVTGHSSLVRNAHNENVQTTEEDIWHIGGTYVFPTAAETVGLCQR